MPRREQPKRSARAKTLNSQRPPALASAICYTARRGKQDTLPNRDGESVARRVKKTRKPKTDCSRWPHERDRRHARRSDLVRCNNEVSDGGPLTKPATAADTRRSLH